MFSAHVLKARKKFFGLFGVTLFAIFAMGQTSSGGQNADAYNHVLKGEAEQQANHLDQALVEYQAALNIDPENVDGNVRLGLLYLMRGDCDHAQLNFHVALKRAPLSADAKGLLGVCEKRNAQSDALSLLKAGFRGIKDPKLRTVVGVELADYYYGRSDNEHAVPVLQILIAMNPDNTDLLFFAQHVYQDMADDTLNRLALLAPDSARMQEAVAEHLVNNGDLQSAIQHYRKALVIDPYLPGTNYELGEAILAVGHDPESVAAARDEFQKAIHIDGDGARVECALARVLDIEGKSDEALADYKRAYGMNSAYPEALMGMARILISKEKPDEAVPYLEKFLDDDPLNADARYQLATALKELHRTNEAQEQLRLFQEIRASKDKVTQLYRQMNKRPATDSTDAPDTKQ
jgi:tetratricopeptide (TPR) repeat protein